MRLNLVALLVPALLLAGCAAPGSDAKPVLTILTHDSYVVDQSVLDAFSALHGAEVRVIAKGDAGAVVNDAVLTKDAPLADVVFGIDNVLLAKAKAAGILEPYRPEGAERIDPAFLLDPEWHLTPTSYGYVNLNYHKASLDARGLAPPTSLEELVEERWRGTLVVPNPATSSPGLAFLLATVAHFGEDGYEDWWRAMEANGLVVAPGWSAAYFTHFAGGGEGTLPLVVSYHSSPPYGVREACTVDGRYVGMEACDVPELETGSVDAPGSVWLQIEGMGVLRGAKQPDLARAFVDFSLTDAYQKEHAERMFVFPVVPGTPVPDYYALVEEPREPSRIDRVTDEDVRRFVDGWTRAVRG